MTKKLLTKIEWALDYYIVYFLYNPHKHNEYIRYMINKWGDKYKTKLNGDK